MRWSEDEDMVGEMKTLIKVDKEEKKKKKKSGLIKQF